MDSLSASEGVVMLLAVVVSVFGWFLRTLHDYHQRLASTVNEHHLDAARMYVRRDDYRADMIEIKTMLRHISEKIDDKADKADK